MNEEEFERKLEEEKEQRISDMQVKVQEYMPEVEEMADKVAKDQVEASTQIIKDQLDIIKNQANYMEDDALKSRSACEIIAEQMRVIALTSERNSSDYDNAVKMIEEVSKERPEIIELKVISEKTQAEIRQEEANKKDGNEMMEEVEDLVDELAETLENEPINRDKVSEINAELLQKRQVFKLYEDYISEDKYEEYYNLILQALGRIEYLDKNLNFDYEEALGMSNGR